MHLFFHQLISAALDARRKPKVAHFVDTWTPGGAEVLIVELCSRLKAHGFIPEIFHFGQPFLLEICKEREITSIIVPEHKLYKSIRTLPLFAWRFSQFLKQSGVDLLHAHLFGPTTAGSLAGALARIPRLGTLHDTYIVEEREARIHLLEMAWLLGARIITVSDTMQGYLRRLGKFSKNAVRTIHNGVDLKKFTAVSCEGFRKKLGIAADEFVVICVGRLVEIKQHDLLLEAFSKVSAEKPLRLLLVGEGPEQERLEALSAEKGLSARVSFLGFRTDIPELLNVSDCFALTSRSEGLSYSIAEAMAAGLPAVVTDVGGNHELIVDGENGFLVPLDDPALFAEKLDTVADNKELRKTFGRNSRARAEAWFSMDAMLDGYLSLYSELLG